MFLQIRTKSVGENVKVSLTCPDDNVTTVEVDIPLDEIKVKKTRGHKTDLKITDEVTITMGYPKLDTFINMNFIGDEAPGMDQIFDMAANCLETISDTEQYMTVQTHLKRKSLNFLIQWTLNSSL